MTKKAKADDKPKTGGKRAALRAAARAKRKAGYAAHFFKLEGNQKRELRRHLRAHPFDEQAARRYEVNFGVAAALGVNAKGRKVVARRERAIRRLGAAAA